MALVDPSSLNDTKRLKELFVKIAGEGNSDNLKQLKHLVQGSCEDPDAITPRMLEKCNSMLDIFQHMLQMDMVSRTKLDNFKELMMLVFRNSYAKSSVVKYIDEYEQSNDTSQPTIRDTDLNINSTAGIKHLTQSYPGRPPSRKFDDLELEVSGNAVNIHSTDSSSHIPAITLPRRFEDAFHHAAKNIGMDWKTFARLAEMEQSAVCCIENFYPKHVDKQAYEAFKYWYGHQSKPSMTIFRKTLRSIPRNDIADDLKFRESNNTR